MYPGKLVPDDFEVPTRVEVAGVLLRPIPLDNWLKDVQAIRVLRSYLDQNPDVELLNPGLSLPDDLVFGISDVCWMRKLWSLRASFAYGVMTADESEELGCLYVFATRKLGYDAEVVSWMREKKLQDLGERIYRFAEEWVPDVWPFDRVTWPRREISWQDWYKLPDKDPQNWPGNHPTYSLVPRRLVSDTFEIPRSVEARRFSLVPLHLSMDSVAKNYDAYMSSFEHLKRTFPSDDEWPSEKTFNEAIIDVGYFHFLRHLRAGFAYSARDSNDNLELGCIYITAPRKANFQAEIRLWVRESEIQSGLEEELYEFAHQWLQAEWPFESLAWPGREIDWEEWDQLPEWGANEE